jgi:prepilin-type N-terminal cleavage/methylation domain-containing protein/prepilin-type processing-associated H-X9-DG protein
MPLRSPRNGFTLVELLVVIGIIALLISILLPSLAKARASGVLVDCQARMRTIGQAMQMYAAQYKGSLPGGSNWIKDGTGVRNKHAATMLSEVLGTEEWEINPVFHDKDTIEPIGTLLPGDNPYSKFTRPFTSHYTASLRLFPATARPDGTGLAVNERYNPPNWTNDPKLVSAYRNLGDIRNSAEVAAWWDASQVPTWGGAAGRRVYPAYPYSDGTDNWGWHSGSNRFVSVNNDNPAYDGSRAVISLNHDQLGLNNAQAQGGIRFRHMKDTTANILYADGHVGQHTFSKATGRTSMPVRELGANYKPATKLP